MTCLGGRGDIKGSLSTVNFQPSTAEREREEGKGEGRERKKTRKTREPWRKKRYVDCGTRTHAPCGTAMLPAPKSRPEHSGIAAIRSPRVVAEDC